MSDVTASPSVRILEPCSYELVSANVHARGASQVWVEGFSAAGKTNFAARLAHHLGWRHIECDGLVLEGGDSRRYADHIDHERLAKLIGNADGERTVIDGVCLREVMNSKLGASTAIFVYVARVSQPTPDSFLWNDMLDAEEVLGKVPWLFPDIQRYHREHSPHQHADFMFLRIES